MKHSFYSIISLIFISLCGLDSFAQSIDRSYIVTTVPTTVVTDPTTLSVTNSNTTIQYFDGLGRPIQTVQKGITPAGKDLVSIVEYDSIGREYRQYLPAPIAGNNGAYVTDFVAISTAQYGSDTVAYNETKFEPSPLNRVLDQQGAGATWQGHTNSVAYLSNVLNEVALYSVTIDDKLKKSMCYDPNTLYKTETKDEDRKTAYEFKDKQGQVILKQSINGAEKVNTYYVYDDFGRLRYVLPPIAADGLTADITFENNNDYLVKYCYLYQYDKRGNNIYKQLPGCEPIFMVYDIADRMVLSQDGNQRVLVNSNNQWIITKYDALGRVITTGTTMNIEASKSLKTLIEEYKSQLITETYINGTGYSNLKFSDAKALSVNYYDSYNFTALQTNGSNLNYITPPDGYRTQHTSANGLLTGTRTYILDKTGTNYLNSAFYYDDRGQVVQSRSSNHLGGYDIAYNQYNFNGSVKKTRKEHNIVNRAVVPEVYTYTYDHAGRLLTTMYELNNKTAVLLVDNSAPDAYDELGRLRKKKRHGGADTEEFDYNIRNWATRIKSGSTFEEILYYNTNLPDNANPSYNGNIAANTWTYNGQTNGYIYYYDKLNRLSSNYSILNNIFQVDYQYSESFNYDKMGNINHLTRWDNGDISDQLTLTYNGNQIKNVMDNGISQCLNSIKEYQDKAKNDFNTTVEEFKYDANGNMITDLDRDIVTIKYNLLNLPDLIQFKNGCQIKNTYDAGGRKLSTRYATLNPGVYNPLIPGEVIEGLDVNENDYVTINGTDYVENMEYTVDRRFDWDVTFEPIDLRALYRVNNPEGYATSATNSGENHGPVYYYYRRDHLGNNREVWQASWVWGSTTHAASTSQQTQYYPSGLPWKSNATDYPGGQPYKYNGKEFVEMHGYDVTDMGWRGQYPAINRFTTIDRKAEKYPWQSPYCVAANNPIRYIDKNGEGPELAIPIVAGLTVIDLALIGTGVVTAGILWERGINDRIQIKQDVKNAVNNFFKTDNSGKKEQDKREKNGKIGLDKNQANMATSIKQNTPDPQPDGSSDPKRPLNEWKPITVVVTGITIAKNIFNNITKPDQVPAPAPTTPAPAPTPSPAPTPIQPKQPWKLF